MHMLKHDLTNKCCIAMRFNEGSNDVLTAVATTIAEIIAETAAHKTILQIQYQMAIPFCSCAKQTLDMAPRTTSYFNHLSFSNLHIVYICLSSTHNTRNQHPQHPLRWLITEYKAEHSMQNNISYSKIYT